MTEASEDPPRPTLTPQLCDVLEVLNKASMELHGYEIARLAGYGRGTVYRILERLRELRIVDDEWEPTTGAGAPPRRVYRLREERRGYVQQLLSERKRP
jgi:DNA-binding PadR family transcriptional regulator